MKEIDKLEKKEILTYKELDNIFNGYLNNKIDDDEMTKVLKLICKNGLSNEETINLTDIFIKSGETFPMNISFVDKHSTGGVGDKTTLIVLPILASLGIRISKMSGRALGYTGGTIDKLESIGVKTDLTKKDFYNAIDKTNMVISSQTANLCPMDKKVYALRDVTGTTNSIPLIASSIMSKKIASGAGKIGKKYDRKVICMLTRMDNPLGDNIGNKLEIEEVIDVLKNKKQGNLRELVIEMSTLMYTLNKNVSKDKARSLVEQVLDNGSAYKKFEEYVKLQGGNLSKINAECTEITSSKSGYIKSINSRIIGETSMALGAGRVKKTDKIDYDAGVVLVKNVGDKVKKGEVICKLYGKNVNYDTIYKAFNISKIKPFKKNIIIKVVY